MSINTDLNHRERQRFAASLRTMSKAADQLAGLLEAEDDKMAAVQLVLLTLEGTTVSELMDVFKQAAIAEIAAKDLDRLRDITGLDPT